MSSVELVRVEPSADFSIAQMTEHDLLEVVEIEETCGLSRWGWDSYRAELDRPEAVTFVARPGRGELAGARTVAGFVAARLNAGELHVNNIGVRPEARRQGLGAALLGLALERAGREGATRAVLEVRVSNLPAQRLYAALGFEVVGERRNYYRDPPEAALVMARPLGGGS
ncbi:MAG TPA: ribosomal protein S18-alanine N-acetyltransferase [Pyrinomonadaceae bacterium]|nr:ribosomal protein S18-alanine N-acetyltransferase [Pyrinomonadaceae bacterium]